MEIETVPSSGAIIIYDVDKLFSINGFGKNTSYCRLVNEYYNENWTWT